MKLFFKKIGGVLIVFLVLTFLLSIGSLWSLRKSSFYKPSFLVNAVETSKFDYIILGASTGLTTLDTKQIDSILELTGINLSMDDTGIPSQYLMLKHFLAEGKTTRYCIIAPGVSSYNAQNEKLSDNDYRFLMFTNRDYVHDYYKGFEDSEAKILSYSKHAPFIGVSFYNAELFYPSLLTLLQPDKRNRFDNKGNYTYPVFQRNNDSIRFEKELKLAFRSPYLAKIKTLCDQNNIQLICYISPMEGTKVNITNSNYKSIDHSQIIKNKKYFYDKDHVNSLGRIQASKAFAQILKEVMTLETYVNKNGD